MDSLDYFKYEINCLILSSMLSMDGIFLYARSGNSFV